MKEYDGMLYSVPRVGDWLKFPATDSKWIARKVTDVFWDLDEYGTLEIRVG